MVMPKLINNFLTVTSTFSRIPVPEVEYNHENTKYQNYMLPFLGLILGLIYYGCALLINTKIDNYIISAIIMIVLNLFVSGGIHFDGFLDTTDCFKSYRPTKAEKAIILKDSTIGAFALIHFSILIMLTIVAYYYLFEYNYLYIFLIVPIISRTTNILLTRLGTVLENDMLSDQLSDNYKKYSLIFLVIYFIIALAITLFINPIYLSGYLIVSVVAIVYTLFFSQRYKFHLDYLSGDLCGHCICMIELISPLVLVTLHLFAII